MKYWTVIDYSPIEMTVFLKMDIFSKTLVDL